MGESEVMLKWLGKYLWPAGAEKDPEFRAEIERLSRRGLFIISVVEIGMPVLGFLLVWAIGMEAHRNYWQTGSFIVLGLFTLALARTPWARRYARALSVASGFACLFLTTYWDLMSTQNPMEAAASFALNVTTVMFVGVMAFPVLPVQTALMGAWSLMVYGGAMAAGAAGDASARGFAILSVVLFTVLSTGLSAISYSRLHTMYRTHQSRLEYQSRLMMAEQSASASKFVAALNHEMNSPLGALQSAMQTIPPLLDRYDTADASRREALRTTARELCEVAAGSVARLSEIAGRMRRMANLDRADVQAIDLNLVLRDLATMVELSADKPVQVVLELEPVPPLVCRPQQITAVLGALLQQACEVSPPGAQVRVATRLSGPHIEVALRDEGEGAAETRELLQPRFTVASNRVSGDWSLFTSRQIIADHGGDIRVQPQPGGGKTVTVQLRTDSRLQMAS